jgi:hypothetical protein
MAHFAEIDSDNKVLRVLVVDNTQEHRGQEFLADDCGLGGTWIQTSYNSNFRKNYATTDGYYNPIADAFYGPQPFASWTLDDAYQWQSPTPMPIDGKRYYWDEDELSWKEIAAL